MPVLVNERAAGRREGSAAVRWLARQWWWGVALFPVVYQWGLGIVHWKAGWDDAAITAAFARTWMETGKIALTPGSESVEGFSSVAWFLLLSPAYLVRGHPALGLVWMKTLAAAFLALAVWLIERIGTREFGDRRAGVTAALLLAWCYTANQEIRNGMEMNLAAALLLGMFDVLTDGTWAGRRGRVVWASGIGGLLLLTRFEMPFMLGLFFYGMAAAAYGQRWGGVRGREFGWLVGSVVVEFVGIELWRHHTFGVWMPNTVYAKRWEPYVDLSSWVKMLGTRLGALNEPVRVLRFPLVIALGVWGCGIWRRRLGREELRRMHPAIWTLGAGCFLFEALIGQNWGHAGRMVASMMPFLILAVVGMGVVALEALTNDRRVVGWVFAAMLAIHGLVWVRHAVVPYSLVSVESVEALGTGADRIRQALGQERLEVMLSDVGGSALCCERLDVVDSGLLADVRLARGGWAGFAGYFQERRPEVVETHSFWAKDAGMYRDGLLDGYGIVASNGVRFFVRGDLYGRLLGAHVGVVERVDEAKACLGVYPEDVRFSRGKRTCLVLNDPGAQRNLL